MFNAYYQDELLYLRDLGREFARANPETARFLAEPGADPDVERLLEGVAFLTGRIRQKLDDELPEVTHGLLEALFPHYLRPLPAFAVVRFEVTAPTQRETLHVPAGAMVESLPVAGTACRFRTAWPVALPPLRLERAEVEHGSPGRLRLGFSLRPGVTLDRLPLSDLRLHLAGDLAIARGLLLCCGRWARGVTARAGGRSVRGLTIAPAGRAPEEALFPFPPGSASGFRTLQEYFAFPAKHHFVDLGGLAALKELGPATAFEVEIALESVPERLPPVSAANVLLGCAPAVNLFPHEADPIVHDRKRAEYRVRPTGDAAHYEVHSIERVVGLVRGAREPRVYRPRFHLGRDGDACGQYQERRRPALIGGGADHHLAITDAPGTDPSAHETLSLSLLCTNRQLPAQLGVGDLRVPGAAVPAGVTVRNLGVPTAAVSPVMAGDLHWRLLAHLALNHGSLLEVGALRQLLALYDLRALVDRQAEHASRRLQDAILAVRAQPATRLLEGVPIRGLAIGLELDEAGVGGPGDAWLLGAVLDEFLAQYVGLNAFTALTVKVQPGGEVHAFAPRLGRRAVV